MTTSFKADNPGCDCCSLNCEDCNPVTTIALFIADVDCDGVLPDIPAPFPPLCTRNNGTYVFRTSFTQIDTCKWSRNLLGEACYGVGGDTSIVIQQPIGCSSGADSISIEFLAATGGGVTVRVLITRSYEVTDFLTIDHKTRFLFTFEDTFETCADAVGATLPLINTTSELCLDTSTGDICNVAGALVTLG